MEIKSRKEWEKRSKQSRIVDIAEDLFNEAGYEATTLDMIAKKAGYSKRNLYQYFSDQNDIFSAVTLKALRKLNSRLDAICALDINGLTKTVNFLNAIFNFFHNYRKSIQNIIFFDVTYCAMNNGNPDEEESFASQAKKLHDENMNLLYEALELGVKDKSILSNYTPKQLLLIIWGQTLGIMHSIAKRYDELEPEYQTTPKQVFENYLKMINNCLQTPISKTPDIRG